MVMGRYYIGFHIYRVLYQRHCCFLFLSRALLLVANSILILSAKYSYLMDQYRDVEASEIFLNKDLKLLFVIGSLATNSAGQDRSQVAQVWDIAKHFYLFCFRNVVKCTLYRTFLGMCHKNHTSKVEYLNVIHVNCILQSSNHWLLQFSQNHGKV